jgi:pSer/pThr/pTyr-binding forkhead associated (FHA) protein
MSGILVFLLRIIMVACLYGFLLWALYTLWRDLRIQNLILTIHRVPPITLSFSQNGEIKTQRFTSAELVVGREPACDLHIVNDTISARHTRLSYHHNQWWVEDLQSTNGTFLNGERIITPTIIIHGDLLQCGNVEFQVVFHTS